MTPKQFAPISSLVEPKIAIRSPLLIAPVALAMLFFTVVGLSAPYMRFDLTTKIQASLLH